ncbi:hypothetical protein DVH26_30800 [Paenibacillus sp. H1-7]|nr:hypothetical protein DVH26_30800 [Paenibacillus sp. H1-7]
MEGQIAEFKIRQTRKTETAFMIQGELINGQMVEGMEIHVYLNQHLQVSGVITEIIKVNEQYEMIIGCSDLDEVDFWDMLNLKDKVLEIK